MKFSLEPEETGTLSLYPDKAYVTYPSEHTAKKADQFALALGNESPGSDILSNSIATGDQDRWAQVLKVRQDTSNSQRRNDIIRDIASTRDPQSTPTPDDIAVVTRLTDDEIYSSNLPTILESVYSNLFTNTVSSVEDNVVIQDAREENEDAAMEVLDRSQYAQQRLMIANDKLEEVNKKYEDAGMVTKGVAFLKGAIPGYTWWKTVDRIDAAPTVSMLSGSNLGEQVSYLYTLPPAEFKETLDLAVDELSNDNILLAQQFAQAVISYSGTTEEMNNLFDVADIADVATAGLSSVGKLATGMTKAGKAILRSPKAIAKQAAQAGMTKTAAISQVIEDTAAGDFDGLARMASNSAELEERLPSIFAPQKAFTGNSTLEAAASNRLRETIVRSSQLSKDFLGTGSLVDRLEPSQLSMAANEAFDRVKDTFTNVNHNIIDMEVVPAERSLLLNTAQIIVKFGRKDGSLFNTEVGAESFAKRYIGLKTSDFTVQQDGVGGFYVAVNKTVADVGAFRKLEIPTELKSPDSLSNQFLKTMRSADYLVSEPAVRARGTVVHSQEYLADYMQKITEPFRGKSKQWTAEMDKVFKSNRTNRKYYNTVEEFENNFLAMNGKRPDEDQAAAYFAYVQLNDLDYLIRDADIVKQKRRLGGEKISFKVIPDEKKTKVNAGDVQKETQLKEFDGKVVDKLPYDSKNFYNVSVVNGNKITKNKSSRFFSEADRKEFDDLLAQGYKAVLDPSESTYYLVREFKRDNIPLGTLNRVEGGHNEYRYKHFVKQAEVKTGADRVTRYKGDKSLFVATTEKQASEISALFDKARLMIKNKDAGAKKFIDENLPLTYGEFTKKIVTGEIDVNVPIMSTRSGQRTTDIRDFSNDFEYFDNGVTSDHNVFGQVGGRYVGERAETLLDVLKSENGVVARTDIEPLLDPMETLRTTTANMLDVRLVNDYKAKSVQDWVQEFGNLIDAPLNKVMANPMDFLQNPKWKSGANADQVIVANNVRQTILSLNNYRNPVESAMQNFKEKVLSSVYDSYGEGARTFVDDKLLFEAKDAQTFMRAAAFNMKLGFFNPKQLFLQASSVVNAVAITGRDGIAASRALPFTRMAMMTDNPDVLRGLANKWSKTMGWDKNDWLEMVENFKNSGFATVSNDVAYLDDFRPKTVAAGSKLAKAWSYHTSFFKEGELVARQVAYGAAYQEWKKANPGKVLDRFAQSKVLSRAKNLTTNMTRDSNAAWQKGWASVATQFFGYQARFMEQLWDGGLLKNGRKLTAVEKRRLMFGMSAMYGAPVYGGAVTAFPMRDYLRDWMAEEGVVFDNVAAEAFLDGIGPAMMHSMIGLDMNWSEVYGPNGLTNITDMMNGDATFYDLFLGASGGVIADTVSTAVPALKGLYDISLSEEGSTFPVLMGDLMEPLKNISTVNSATKLFEAINTHRYLSRNGTHLTDTTVSEALVSAIMGVSPDRVSEAYAQIAGIKANKEQIQGYQKEIEKWTKLGLESTRKGDIDSAKKYFSRAHSAGIRGGLSIKEINLARKRALTTTPMDENIMETFEKEVLRRKQNTENAD